MKYQSFTGGCTLDAAIRHLGRDHVCKIIRHDDYQGEITRRIRGAWFANLGRDHRAYCAIMQAGATATRNAISVL